MLHHIRAHSQTKSRAPIGLKIRAPKKTSRPFADNPPLQKILLILLILSKKDLIHFTLET